MKPHYIVSLSFTPEEFEPIESAAREAGIKVSKWIKKTVAAIVDNARVNSDMVSANGASAPDRP
jgi:hypothetical protein